jgi:hypothetical protein
MAIKKIAKPYYEKALRFQSVNLRRWYVVSGFSVPVKAFFCGLVLILFFNQTQSSCRLCLRNDNIVNTRRKVGS